MHPTIPYEKFGPFYDAVMGDRKQSAEQVRALLRKYHPQGKTLLELGCGTGSVLKHLRHHYQVSGLDLSPQMLKVARKKLPGVPLYHADMISFELDKHFDAIICVFDSINHLTQWNDWERVFVRACTHLNDRGVFLFDINTEVKLRQLDAAPVWIHRFDSHFLLMDVSCNSRGVSRWNIKVFEHRYGEQFTLHEEDIYEKAFPRTRIQAALHKKFRKVAVLDLSKGRASATSEKLHFVCAK